ncbi:MAG: fumarylacetoacetase [Pseudomonadota bacterium]|nr:fumarylacetoacetase [Pseudomonadota bacterium]
MLVPAPESPVDATHDPRLVSWLESANLPGIDFPIQNLPLGRFRPKAQRDQPEAEWRIGVAIGDQVLDLKQGSALCPWPDGIDELLAPLAAGDLASFMAMGPVAWRRLRAALSTALAEGSVQSAFLESCLVPFRQVQMAMPCAVTEYTEFQIGLHTARRIGALFRPGQPLLVNQPWLPAGRHGRASAVALGDAVRRPRGQVKKAGREPAFVPSRGVDFELELGWWVGTANPLGTRVAMPQAEQTLFGLGLLNGWTARDIQPWEGQPLGPFLAKSFATSVSPWVVSLAALAPFRKPVLRPAGDPQPLPHLDSPFNRAFGGFDIRLQVWLQTAQMRNAGAAPALLLQANALDAYWSPAQLVAHHTSNGCNLRTGDLIGTGALSGPLLDQGATLLELTQGGKKPIVLPGGEQRLFLEDGDTVMLKGYCEAPGAVRIGLGEVSATVLPVLAE